MVFSMFDTCFVKNYCANPFDKVRRKGANREVTYSQSWEAQTLDGWIYSALSLCVQSVLSSSSSLGLSYQSSELPLPSLPGSWLTSKCSFVISIWSMLCLKNCTNPTRHCASAWDWFLIDKGMYVMYTRCICHKVEKTPPLRMMSSWLDTHLFYLEKGTIWWCWWWLTLFLSLFAQEWAPLAKQMLEREKEEASLKVKRAIV